MMGKFLAAINCIDGRVQIPVIEYLKNKYGVDFVDMVTAPGADKDVSFAKEAVKISVEHHGSKVVAVVGHENCAGFPGSKEEHEVSIRDGLEVVKSWGLGVEVMGLWARLDGVVEEIGL